MLSNTVSRGISKAYAGDGLSVHEWRVMAVLGRFPGVPASEVVQRTAMDKVRVSRAVATLVAAGHVERRVDTGDRRRSALRLSASGRDIYARVVPAALAYEKRLLAALSPDDRRHLDAMLARLSAQAAAMQAPRAGLARSRQAAAPTTHAGGESLVAMGPL